MIALIILLGILPAFALGVIIGFFARNSGYADMNADGIEMDGGYPKYLGGGKCTVHVGAGSYVKNCSYGLFGTCLYCGAKDWDF